MEKNVVGSSLCLQTAYKKSKMMMYDVTIWGENYVHLLSLFGYFVTTCNIQHPKAYANLGQMFA